MCHHWETSTHINYTLIALCKSLTCDVLYQNHKQLFCKRAFLCSLTYLDSISFCPDATAACNPSNTCRPSKPPSSIPSFELKPEKMEQVSIIIYSQLENNSICKSIELQKLLHVYGKVKRWSSPRRALMISYASVSVLYWSFLVLLSCVEGVNLTVEQYVQLACNPISTSTVVWWENQ